MKIFIDIGHPAHVHYFRNFIKIMEEKGHSFLITARDKEVAHSLLTNYEIDFVDRGSGGKGLLGKALYLIKANLILLKLALKNQPDYFMSFSSPYAAQVSWLLRKPHIAFTDTEHATLGNLAFVPFSEIVCTPSCFKKDFGKKHVRFPSYMELCYLFPKYFTPDHSTLTFLGVEKDEKFSIIRFVSWGATHDIGHSGISNDNKVKAFERFSKFGKVFISSEGDLPKSLEQYRIDIPTDKMHDALAFASLLYGESATMASECAMLGTPSIFLDNDGRGYTDEQENKYGLVYNYTESIEDQEKSTLKGVEILSKDNLKEEWVCKKDQMLSNKIDVTAFMVWIVDNYPESVEKIRSDPDFLENNQSTFNS